MMLDLTNKSVQSVPIDKIEPDPNQPRRQRNEEEEKSLAASMAIHKQLVAIIVVLVGGIYKIIDGELRWRAAKSLGLTHLFAIVLDTTPSPAELKLIQLSINSNRADINPIDRCEAYLLLMKELNIGPSELATRLAKSKSSVTRILSHKDLPLDKQEMVRRGELGSAEAYQLVLAAKAKSAEQTIAPKYAKQQIKKPSLRKLVCELPACSLAIRASKSLTIDELIDALKGLVKLCRKAKVDKIDLSTMALVLRDQNRAAKELEGGAT